MAVWTLSTTLKFDFWPRVVLSSIFMDFHFKNNSFSNHLYVGLKRPIYRFPWTFVALRPSANYSKIVIFLKENVYFQGLRKKGSWNQIIKLNHKIWQKHGQKPMIFEFDLRREPGSNNPSKIRPWTVKYYPWIEFRPILKIVKYYPSNPTQHPRSVWSHRS